MKTSQLFALSITVVLLATTRFNLVQSNSGLIAQLCKQTPYYNFCFSSLVSDPRSSKADVHGLALIMVDVVKAKTKTALVLIHNQFRKSPALKQPLSACASYYDTILTLDIPEAVEALVKGDPKFAQDGTNDAALEANFCEAKFHVKPSPLANINKDIHESAVVAASIIRLLL